MKIDYPIDFALSKRRTIMAAKVGYSSWYAIIDCHFSKQEWENDPQNWIALPYSETGREKDETCYLRTPSEVEKHWDCVQLAQEKMMAFWLVEQGKSPALNPALEMVRAGRWSASSGFKS